MGSRPIGTTFSDPKLAPRPTLAHYLAMSLPVGHVITTNYDDLLERSLTALKRYPVIVVRQEDVARTGGLDGVHLVKLHGDVDEPGEVVLCRDDYDEFFERRPAIALLLEGLLLNRTFFFIGYGLRDPNFRQVYGRVGRMLREAHRPAFATSFESAGVAGKFIANQWREKQLHLIDVPGSDEVEKQGNLLRFLDRLADRVASSTPRLLLSPGAKVPEPLGRVKDLLLAVGEELTMLCRDHRAGPLSGADAGLLADALEFLADQGWRPPSGTGTTLCRLWENLAGLTGDPADRRRRLVAALEGAEDAFQVRRVSEALADPMRAGSDSVT